MTNEQLSESTQTAPVEIATEDDPYADLRISPAEALATDSAAIATGQTAVKIKLPAGMSSTQAFDRLPGFLRDSPTTDFEWTKKQVTVPEARGGGRMDDSAGDGVSCTTGFTVRDSSGATGIVTAGHCIDNGMYYWLTRSTKLSMWHQDWDAIGMYGDLSWYKVSGTEYAEFYAHRAEIRDYKSSGWADNGMVLCNYGRASDRDYVKCAEVIDASAADGGAWNLVRTDRDITIKGDSGGPWYAWNTGYGIHYGDIDGTSSFSQVHYIDDAFGINTLKK